MPGGSRSADFRGGACTPGRDRHLTIVPELDGAPAEPGTLPTEPCAASRPLGRDPATPGTVAESRVVKAGTLRRSRRLSDLIEERSMSFRRTFRTSAGAAALGLGLLASA